MTQKVTTRRKRVPRARALSAVRRYGTAYGLLFPAMFLLLMLNIVAALFGVYLSFVNWNYFHAEERMSWAGLAHYIALFNDPVFLQAIKNTAVWCAVVIPASFIFGLYIALLLNEDVRGKWLFRVLILLPWAFPLVSAAVGWAFVFNPTSGPLNDLLYQLGFTEMRHMNWLGSADFAMPIVMGVQIWRTSPFFAVTLLAGLKSIPDELYQAAKIDGAGIIRRFRYVTLPLLRPVTTVVLLQGLIWSLFNFTALFVMTGGGPAHSSEVLTIYLWRQAFPLADVGRGSAVGALLVIFLSLVGTLWVTKVMKEGSTE
jgi:multiple sugar transport system permease protein